MGVDRDAVRERYEGGRPARPLVGGSVLQISTAPDGLSVQQRLWTATVTWAQLDVALEMLGERPPSTRAVGFSEELRRYYSGGPQVQPTCSRTPNLCAVVLTDLGYLDAAGPA